MTYPEEVTFWVEGAPATQGSKKHVGRGRMVEVAKGLKPWRRAVHDAAKVHAEATGRLPLGPLTLNVTFYLPHGKQREAVPWKPRKDLDKLIRAVGDSLTSSGLIEDDAHITHIVARKVWATDQPGAHITIRSTA